MIVLRDDLTRQLLHTSVESAGYVYGSISVASIEVALSLLEEGVDVDVLVTDVAEQSMPPRALLRRIRALRPHLPVLAVAESTRLQEVLLGDGAAAVIQGAVPIESLLEEVTRTVSALAKGTA